MKILKKIGVVFACGFGILIVLVLYSSITSEPVPDHQIFEHEQILVMAHRGGRGLWPENTIYAFRHAEELGVDVLDFDVHKLKDGTFVVIHDGTVDRTTDGTGEVADYSLADIKKLDAGYRWTNDAGATFPYRGKGIVIPTLTEVFKQFPETIMNIEIKQGEPGSIILFCQRVREHDMQDRVVIASFSKEVIREFRQVCPEVATAAAAGEAWPFFVMYFLRITSAYHAAAETMQVPAYRNGSLLFDRRFVSNAHDHNMRVYVWTINNENEMDELIQMGVDGINTDYPDKLLRLLRQSQVTSNK